MGAQTFFTEQDGTDAAAAFTAAVDHARYEYGHRGYTGTIAEKREYIVILSDPLPAPQARLLADQLLAAADPRVDDKWGPAGALAISGGRREHRVDLPLRASGYPYVHAAAADAVADQLLPGERVIPGITGSYRTNPATGLVLSGTAVVPTHGAPVHTGWLFFGSASS